MRNPQGARSVPGRSYQTQRNTHSQEAQVIRGRLSAVPSAAIAPVRPHNTTTPKPWQRLAHGITDPHAAVASSFRIGRLGLGHQGIRDVLVGPLEDRVVVPRLAHGQTVYTAGGAA